MQHRFSQFLGALVLGALALALGAGLSLGTAGNARAQSMTPDQMGAAMGNCAAGDSWCAYCMTHASADACKQYPPMMAAAGSSSTMVDTLAATPAPMAGMTGSGSAAPSGLAGLLNPAPGISWQYCPSSVTGVMWVPTSSQGGNLIC
jgi:hypothetical protein